MAIATFIFISYTVVLSGGKKLPKMARPGCRNTSVFAIILVVIVVLDETKEQQFVHSNDFQRVGYMSFHCSHLLMYSVITVLLQLSVNYCCAIGTL